MKEPSERGVDTLLYMLGHPKALYLTVFMPLNQRKRVASNKWEEMNSGNFTKWFTDSLLKNLPVPSTTVMNNALYHSVIYDKVPTLATRKEENIHWLHQHSISTIVGMKKAELLDLLSGCKPLFPKT